jgi:hypothetical protein
MWLGATIRMPANEFLSASQIEHRATITDIPAPLLRLKDEGICPLSSPMIRLGVRLGQWFSAEDNTLPHTGTSGYGGSHLIFYHHN